MKLRFPSLFCALQLLSLSDIDSSSLARLSVSDDEELSYENTYFGSTSFLGGGLGLFCFLRHRSEGGQCSEQKTSVLLLPAKHSKCSRDLQVAHSNKTPAFVKLHFEHSSSILSSERPFGE